MIEEEPFKRMKATGGEEDMTKKKRSRKRGRGGKPR